MKDRAIAHVGYVVHRMDAAVKRFQREGAEVTLPPTLDPRQKVEVCLVTIDGDLSVELVAPTDDPECPIKGSLARGGGLHHVCYYVHDLDQALREERQAQALVVCEPTYAVAFKRDVAFVHRRSGLVVELMTRAETSGEGRG